MRRHSTICVEKNFVIWVWNNNKTTHTTRFAHKHARLKTMKRHHCYLDNAVTHNKYKHRREGFEHLNSHCFLRTFKCNKYIIIYTTILFFFTYSIESGL